MEKSIWTNNQCSTINYKKIEKKSKFLTVNNGQVNYVMYVNWDTMKPLKMLVNSSS